MSPDALSLSITRPNDGRTGFSLTELLVASAIGLMVMAAVASLFGTLGASVREMEANVALAERLRAVSARLRYDLAGVTADLTRPNAPESGMGYFEYIEGPRRDHNAGTAEADVDDVLLFTSRSVGRQFTGDFTSVLASGSSIATAVESPYAEIAWFCKPAPDSEQTVQGLRLHRLHRRELLSVAYVGQSPFASAGSANLLSGGSLATNVQTALLNFDLSIRNLGSPSVPVFAPNSLADLARREARFLRSGTFPFTFSGTASPALTFDSTYRQGEDVALGNVIGFDVRAFDPEAPRQVHAATGVPMQPGDPGYAVSISGSAPRGAYVDLGWGAAALGGMVAGFPGVGANPALLTTYDSWSRHYAFIGAVGAAQATAPYGVSLRGIEVRIRCYEPASKQVRQFTIRHTFVKR